MIRGQCYNSMRADTGKPLVCHVYSLCIVVYPLWPDHVSTNIIKVTVTDDTRDGFWGHAVVGMEWSYPNSELNDIMQSQSHLW